MKQGHYKGAYPFKQYDPTDLEITAPKKDKKKKNKVKKKDDPKVILSYKNPSTPGWFSQTQFLTFSSNWSPNIVYIKSRRRGGGLWNWIVCSGKNDTPRSFLKFNKMRQKTTVEPKPFSLIAVTYGTSGWMPGLLKQVSRTSVQYYAMTSWGLEKLKHDLGIRKDNTGPISFALTEPDNWTSRAVPIDPALLNMENRAIYDTMMNLIKEQTE